MKNSNCNTCGWLTCHQEKCINGKKWKSCGCLDVYVDININPLTRVGHCEHWKKQTKEQKEFLREWEKAK